MPDTEDIAERHPAASPASIALYIGAMVDELGGLAKTNGLEALGYILDMARLEADEIAKGPFPDAGWTAARKRRSG